MNKYNPNCKACKFLVYGTPIIVLFIFGVVLFKIGNLEYWIAYAIAVPIYLPTSFWIGKQMPMLHEYFNQPKPSKYN